MRGVDYVAAPYMLSKEVSTVYITDPNDANKTRRATGEINWSLGTYIPVPEVEKAFSVSGLPRPAKHRAKPTLQTLVGLQILARLYCRCAAGWIFHARAFRFDETGFSQTVTLQPLPNPDGTQVFFSQPFELAGRRNIRIIGESPVQ